MIKPLITLKRIKNSKGGEKMKPANILKKEFIAAYRAMFGVTKKKAIEVFNESSFEAILNIIKWYESQCHLAFYND